MGQVVTFIDYKPPARFDDVPWTQAVIEEAATIEGSYTAIETVTFAVPDADPTDPSLRSFTTDQGTAENLWYRVYFLDDDGNASTTTAPAQNSEPDESAQFATPDDLAARLGITLTDDEEERAELLLTQASKLIQDATRQTIRLVTDDELVRPGSFGNRIRLPQRPVVEVTSISASLPGGDPVDLTETSWYLDGDELVAVGFLGLSERSFGISGRGWLAPTYTLTITYTHGYETVPDLAKQVCLEAVIRAWTNPGAVLAETYGSQQVQYQRAPGMMLTDFERKQLNDRFGRQQGSVALR